MPAKVPDQKTWFDPYLRDAERRAVHKAAEIALELGDRVHIHTAAGGGFGPPMERDPDAVASDVRGGYVSAEQARTVYGVILTPDGAVDDAATTLYRRLNRAAKP